MSKVTATTRAFAEDSSFDLRDDESSSSDEEEEERGEVEMIKRCHTEPVYEASD